jgi:hypothetical protein
LTSVAQITTAGQLYAQLLLTTDSDPGYGKTKAVIFGRVLPRGAPFLSMAQTVRLAATPYYGLHFGIGVK